MKQYYILGMMSGTSLDGLDLALVRLQQQGDAWQYAFQATHFIPYDQARQQRLEAAIKLPAPELLAFHAEYGKWLGACARQFLEENKLHADAIASHGHTIHHRPEQGFTFQLGCPRHLALEAGVRTIGDFRSLDVALGGQGAPLVPIGDRLLFGDYSACLNLGGIGNISFEKGGRRLAFDTGVANMLLNPLSQRAGKTYDAGGEIARIGKLVPEVLEAWDRLEYYRLPFPKSTGYEDFKATVWPVVQNRKEPAADLLHTAVRHIAGQIGQQLRPLLGSSGARLLVTGGGALNTYLVECIGRELPGVEVVVPEAQLIAFKEALVFALLGALRMEGQVNVLASVTGARRDSCSGELFER
ncbi:anhydro-N-acetylmuramic acid kinase [Robiginitalea sp. M366]|uniref:anhydro-N-acetylmuramic acid kinase n=1 Tax=Robiginitalea aestuariiviva TaxID=3036903 RepID=UPI00240D57E8|nr:anhydro-N-acetylmuramic acid kinase [Robiginitalea aestuariiviva]MDG1573264.1 anhydro-N-acetylmuramic acid kinase [Robiginitalea aestuariiviva]